MKERTGYKVVRVWRDSLRSAVTTSREGGKRYKVNAWVRPDYGCGPLGVFDSKNLEDAKSFARQHDYNKKCVYKCLYVPSKHKKFWNKYGDWEALVPGTVFADAVMLLEEVEE